MDKYRIERSAIGPAYSVEAMKDLKPNLNSIMEKNIEIMRKRRGEAINIDTFCNIFLLDRCHKH
jgi:hypothetical protein